jgi:hypothetical protein
MAAPATAPCPTPRVKVSRGCATLAIFGYALVAAAFKVGRLVIMALLLDGIGLIILMTEACGMNRM